MTDANRLTPEKCRAQAETCRTMAAEAKKPEHRVMLLHMAETWERLAADIPAAH